MKMKALRRLRQTLLAFPDDGHVRDVCKLGQGEAACRYLVLEDGEHRCQKYGALRDVIDRRALEKSMRARGDNCEGVIALLQRGSGALIGNKVSYRESAPPLAASGVVEGIEIAPPHIAIRVRFDDGRNYDARHGLDQVQIDIAADGMSLGVRGAGALAGITTVHF